MITQGKLGDISWRRLLAESLAIVVSILLAFGIDAWWEQRQEDARERVLLVGLLDDFRSSRAELVNRLELARRIADAIEAFLTATDDYTPLQPLPVPETAILAVLSTPTYEPATSTLDAALASGDLEIIKSDDIRRELADWRRILADLQEDEIEAKRVTNAQVVPVLGETHDLRSLYARIMPWTAQEGDVPGTGDAQVPVMVSTDLRAAVALRKFVADFVAAGLEQLLVSMDGLITRLETEIDD